MVWTMEVGVGPDTHLTFDYEFCLAKQILVQE